VRRGRERRREEEILISEETEIPNGEDEFDE
jgi:hypothetical protein